MNDNNHLDLAALRESNEFWFEDIDLYNPFSTPDSDCTLCEGDGEMGCENCLGEGQVNNVNFVPESLFSDELEYLECPDCKGEGTRPCKVCIDPDDESDEYFDILWDTAFNIPYLVSGLTYDAARRIAWKRGWLLFEYDNEYWIAAGSCGYDFTWVKASLALELCGALPVYYVDSLQKGGNVFVSPEERVKIAVAAAKTAQMMALRWEWTLQDYEKIASYGAVADIYEHERQLQEADRLIQKQAQHNTKVE